MLILGTLGIGTFNTLLYTGLQRTPAINGLLLQSLQPAMIVVLGALVFGEFVRMRQVTGICLSIMGALLIVLRGKRFFAWINRNRRLAKDVEATLKSAAAFLDAAAMLMLRRLARSA